MLKHMSEIRNYSRRRGVKSNIPENERNRKHKKQGRTKRLSYSEYRRRSVERAFAWLEAFKRIAVRFEVLEISFIGMLYLVASTILWRVLG